MPTGAICPNCGFANRETARFCSNCASPLVTGLDKAATTAPGEVVSQSGKILHDRYRIERELGRGGFGAVYRAWDSSLSRACAVKENLDTSPEAQRQFAREASVLANLTHPNLPRVTDHFSLKDQGQYLVMDFVEGEDLATLVERQGAIPVSKALEWVSQVADALSYLHTRPSPVLHRDIKPSNIRITPEGKAVLVDFGLVKFHSPDMKTTIGARAVTPGYAPPEQYGQGKTDPRTDIYALGATLHNLLTGKAPLESVQRMAGGVMVPAQQVNPQVPVSISQAIEKAMAIDPGRRFQSAGEFRNALRMDVVAPVSPYARGSTVLVQPPVEAQGAPAIAQAPSMAAPKKSKMGMFAGFGVAGVVLVCVVIAAVVGLIAWNSQQEEEHANQTATAVALASTQTQSVQATSTEGARQTAEAQLTGTAQAIVQATAQAIAQATAAEQARIEATAQAYQTILETGRNWPVILTDAFDSVIYSWPIDTSEDDLAIITRSIDSGTYNWTMDAKQDVVAWVYYPDAGNVSDFYLAADMVIVQAPADAEVGFVLRFSETSSNSYFYTFRISNSGEYSFDIYQAGDWSDLIPSTPSPAIQVGASNRVEVVAEGSHFIFFINGNFLAEFFDDSLSVGKVALAVSLFNAGDFGQWVFDNAILRAP